MMSVYTEIKLGKIYKYSRSRICIFSLFVIEVLVTYLFLHIFFYEENPWCHRHDDHHERVFLFGSRGQEFPGEEGYRQRTEVSLQRSHSLPDFLQENLGKALKSFSFIH